MDLGLFLQFHYDSCMVWACLEKRLTNHVTQISFKQYPNNTQCLTLWERGCPFDSSLKLVKRWPSNNWKKYSFWRNCWLKAHTIWFAKIINPLSTNPTNWSNTTNCLSVFDHFVGLALKGLKIKENKGVISIHFAWHFNASSSCIMSFFQDS